MHRVLRPNPALPLLAVLLLPPGLSGAQERSRTALDRASSTFAVADVDGDGRLDAQELAAASIRARVVTRWDEDRDRHLSRDEFLLYYRQLVIDAGRPLGREFVAEAERIRKVREGRAPQGAVPEPRPGAEGEPARAAESPLSRPRRPITTAEAYRRARAALEERLTRARRERSGRTLEVGGARRALGWGGTGGLNPGSEIRSRLGGTMAAPSASQHRALERRHALLEARARRAGWTEQQLAGQKLRVLEELRAGEEERDVNKGGGGRSEGRGVDREERGPEDADPKPGGQSSPPARPGGGSGPRS